MSKQQPAAEPKKRRSIDDRIAELQAKQARQLLETTARANAEALLSDVKHKRWADARVSLELLDHAIAKLEANGG